jgi:hypothetical protein
MYQELLYKLCGAVWFREVELEINGLSDYSPLDWKMQYS